MTKDLSEIKKIIELVEIMSDPNLLDSSKLVEKIKNIQLKLNEIDDGIAPNIKNLRIALNSIVSNVDVSEEAVAAVQHHLKLTSAYTMREVIQQESALLKKTDKPLNEEELGYLAEIQETKETLRRPLNVKSFEEFNEAQKENYLKKLATLDRQMAKETAEAVEFTLQNRLTRTISPKDLALKNADKVGTHGAYQVVSKNKSDYGTTSFVKQETKLSNEENSELMLEQAANGIVSLSFPETVAPVNSFISETGDKGVRSRTTAGVAFYAASLEAKKDVTNIEDFISKNMTLLDPDGHGGNGFLHNNTLTKIDNGRSGWLNFGDRTEIGNFISARFVNDRFWSQGPKIDMQKLVSAMAKDLSRINQDNIEKSLIEASTKFNAYPFLMPDVRDMGTYMQSAWEIQVINNPKEFVKILSARFKEQHELQRDYVISEAIDRKLLIDGMEPLDFIRQPENRLFLDAYNKYHKPYNNPLKGIEVAPKVHAPVLKQLTNLVDLMDRTFVSGAKNNNLEPQSSDKLKKTAEKNYNDALKNLKTELSKLDDNAVPNIKDLKVAVANMDGSEKALMALSQHIQLAAPSIMRDAVKLEYALISGTDQPLNKDQLEYMAELRKVKLAMQQHLNIDNVEQFTEAKKQPYLEKLAKLEIELAEAGNQQQEKANAKMELADLLSKVQVEPLNVAVNEFNTPIKDRSPSSKSNNTSEEIYFTPKTYSNPSSNVASSSPKPNEVFTPSGSLQPLPLEAAPQIKKAFSTFKIVKEACLKAAKWISNQFNKLVEKIKPSAKNIKSTAVVNGKPKNPNGMEI